MRPTEGPTHNKHVYWFAKAEHMPIIATAVELIED
jgi:hypothetical protein